MKPTPITGNPSKTNECRDIECSMHDYVGITSSKTALAFCQSQKTTSKNDISTLLEKFKSEVSFFLFEQPKPTLYDLANRIMSK